MRVFYPWDVSRVDRNSKFFGVPPIILMENAGRSVADTIYERYPPTEYRNVVVFSGTGNNGGDGFVAARHLSTLNYHVTVVLLGSSDRIRSEEARANWDTLKKMFLSINLLEIKDSSSLNKVAPILEKTDIVIDAILGVGSKGAPRGLYKETIRFINEYKSKHGFKIVSIDIPTGLDVFEGKTFTPAIKPDLTITFIANKNGLNEENGGEIVIKDIGQPPESETVVGPGDILNLIQRRDPWSHKGDFGKIMIVGGGKHYYGAPTLTGLAALKTGADLVYIFAPESAARVIKNFSPDLIVRPLDGEYLKMNHVSELIDFSNNVDVVVLGPGLGVEEETIDTAYELVNRLSKLGKKVVVDADGLKALAKHGIPKGNMIITPHAGEFKMIFNVSVSKEINERMKQVLEAAKNHKCTILLKGHIDVISDGEKVKLNITGNPGMTVGGTGDVLTGITAALYSLTNDPLQAASSAAFLSGYAGDIAFEKFGYSLLATDVLNFVPEAILKLFKEYM